MATTGGISVRVVASGVPACVVFVYSITFEHDKDTSITAFKCLCKELVCHFLNTWPCLPFGGRELMKIDISLMLKELSRDCMCS